MVCYCQLLAVCQRWINVIDTLIQPFQLKFIFLDFFFFLSATPSALMLLNFIKYKLFDLKLDVLLTAKWGKEEITWNQILLDIQNQCDVQHESAFWHFWNQPCFLRYHIFFQLQFNLAVLSLKHFISTQKKYFLRGRHLAKLERAEKN